MRLINLNIYDEPTTVGHGEFSLTPARCNVRTESRVSCGDDTHEAGHMEVIGRLSTESGTRLGTQLRTTSSGTCHKMGPHLYSPLNSYEATPSTASPDPPG